MTRNVQNIQPHKNEGVHTYGAPIEATRSQRVRFISGLLIFWCVPQLNVPFDQNVTINLIIGIGIFTLLLGCIV